MLRLREEQGVTLIEIIIALAIAGLLASSILFGRDNLRNQLKFSQALDTAVNTLQSAQTEAYTTVNGSSTSSTPKGNDDQYAILGRVITLTPNSSIIKVDTITYEIGGNRRINSNTKDEYTVVVPWQIKYTGSAFPVYIVYSVFPDGQLHAYTLNNNSSFAVGTQADGVGAGDLHAVNYRFTGTGGQTGRLNVDDQGNVRSLIP